MTLPEISATLTWLGELADWLTDRIHHGRGRPPRPAWDVRREFQGIPEWCRESAKSAASYADIDSGETHPQLVAWDATMNAYGAAGLLLVTWQLYLLGVGKKPRHLPTDKKLLENMRSYCRWQAGMLTIKERAILSRQPLGKVQKLA